MERTKKRQPKPYGIVTAFPVYVQEIKGLSMSAPVTIGTHRQEIIVTLDKLYEIANTKWQEYNDNQHTQWELSEDLIELLEGFWRKAPGRANSAITNLTTCIVSKVVEPVIDCRYHREPGDGMPEAPMGANCYFSGRGISEKIVAPWLANKDFITARSGWQTRTFERPRPYTRDYQENIEYVKNEFLDILEKVQMSKAEDVQTSLAYLFYKQIQHREGQQIQLTVPNISNIHTIISFFQKHFLASYKPRGVARLPVLAIYAVYSCILKESERYQGYQLAPLQLHEAADVRTGAVGDIEILSAEGKIFEAFEIKYNITIDEDIIRTAYNKFRSYPTLRRYYILTTAEQCGGQDAESLDLIHRIRESHGAEVIVNGVLPTITYFLRLLKDSASIFPPYVELLKSDKSITYEHRQKWNDVVIS